MKRVLIIYTGGTIGMTRTENGYAPRAGYFRAALDAIPDLRAPEMPEWEFYELSPLLDSSNMTVREWNCIAELIAQKYDDYDGFVVLHGTDTMAYTASALSFMLDGLDKPVVLTGSQIPLCEIRSDGRDNLITALLIAGEGIVREVCLYFGGKLLRGNRATKYSADGLIAFVSPNYPSLAEAGISIKYNEAALLPRQKGGLRLQKLDNVPIGGIKGFPGIQFSLFESIMTEKLRGIVIETLALFHRRLHLPVSLLRQPLAHDGIVKYHGSKNVRDLFHLAWSPFRISNQYQQQKTALVSGDLVLSTTPLPFQCSKIYACCGKMSSGKNAISFGGFHRFFGKIARFFILDTCKCRGVLYTWILIGKILCTVFAAANISSYGNFSRTLTFHDDLGESAPYRHRKRLFCFSAQIPDPR